MPILSFQGISISISIIEILNHFPDIGSAIYVIILLLHLLKRIHNMFYKTTYNGITLQG